jgi:pSer/pThr/pTyr-binding forkhead associated (FHA) protein
VARCANCGRTSDLDSLHNFCAHCGWRMRPAGSTTELSPPVNKRGLIFDRPISSGNESRRVSLSPSGVRALRTSPCPSCTRAIDRSLHFCPHCGLKTGFNEVKPIFCGSCGTRMSDDDAFCAACGEPLQGGLDSPDLTVSTQPRGITPMVVSGSGVRGPRLSLLAEDGDVVSEIPLERGEIVVGRSTGDVQFDDDDAVSPEHAVLTWKDNALHVRDLGSSNGSWLYILAPQALTDGDVLLIGSQVIRFRKLSSGFLLDDTELRQAGSRTPQRDDAMLEQLRADGSVRDVLYLSPGRTILIGRDHGDWAFPYDPTMSARHAEIRSVPQRDEYVVRDLGSRNGIGVLVRGERAVRGGERLLFGRKMLRADLA